MAKEIKETKKGKVIKVMVKGKVANRAWLKLSEKMP